MNASKILPIFIILTIIGLGAGGYFYFQYTKAQKELQTIKTDPSTVTQAAQEEVKRLVSEIGQLMELPANEEPTVATVSDIDKLKDQPFFTNAKNGDKVVIYPNSKKAILYRPENKKILDVAPINIGTSSAQQASLAKIVLRNGTETAGLTSKLEDTIKKAYPQANITSKDNASKKDYEKSVVVVLTDTAKEAASNIAKILNVPVGSLPEGETKPDNADILIIIGQDKAS